jgi:prolipoprotein diacylglyceryltransferase
MGQVLSSFMIVGGIILFIYLKIKSSSPPAIHK